MANQAPRPTLAEALRSPELLAMMPRLAAYAAGCMRRAGWVEGRDRAPSKLMVEDALHEMVVCCLAGGRAWPATVPLDRFLFGVIRSVVSHRARAAKRLQEVAFEEDVPAPSSRGGRDPEWSRRWLKARMREAVRGGDPDVEALFTAYVDGLHERGDLAGTLGWTPERLSAVRDEMKRRIEAAVGPKDDVDDERTEEDGPRGAAHPPGRRTG
jgi:hypothetical protein